MTSGNFIIGHRLNYENFVQFVLPQLKSRKLSVLESTTVENEEGRDAILAAIGGQPLEENIEASLKAAWEGYASKKGLDPGQWYPDKDYFVRSDWEHKE